MQFHFNLHHRFFDLLVALGFLQTALPQFPVPGSELEIAREAEVMSEPGPLGSSGSFPQGLKRGGFGGWNRNGSMTRSF